MREPWARNGPPVCVTLPVSRVLPPRPPRPPAFGLLSTGAANADTFVPLPDGQKGRTRRHRHPGRRARHHLTVAVGERRGPNRPVLGQGHRRRDRHPRRHRRPEQRPRERPGLQQLLDPRRLADQYRLPHRLPGEHRRQRRSITETMDDGAVVTISMGPGSPSTSPVPGRHPAAPQCLGARSSRSRSRPTTSSPPTRCGVSPSVSADQFPLSGFPRGPVRLASGPFCYPRLSGYTCGFVVGPWSILFAHVSEATPVM